MWGDTVIILRHNTPSLMTKKINIYMYNRKSFRKSVFRARLRVDHKLNSSYFSYADYTLWDDVWLYNRCYSSFFSPSIRLFAIVSSYLWASRSTCPRIWIASYECCSWRSHLLWSYQFWVVQESEDDEYIRVYIFFGLLSVHCRILLKFRIQQQKMQHVWGTCIPRA